MADGVCPVFDVLLIGPGPSFQPWDVFGCRNRLGCSAELSRFGIFFPILGRLAFTRGGRRRHAYHIGQRIGDVFLVVMTTSLAMMLLPGAFRGRERGKGLWVVHGQRRGVRFSLLVSASWSRMRPASPVSSPNSQRWIAHSGVRNQSLVRVLAKVRTAPLVSASRSGLQSWKCLVIVLQLESLLLIRGTLIVVAIIEIHISDQGGWVV